MVFSSFVAVGQNIFLVDNSPGAPTGPHVFSDLQTAIDATVAGDIIHVKPSATSYGTATITAANDSISIFGIGINPNKDNPVLSTVTTIHVDASNVRLSGLILNTNLEIAYTGVGAVAISNVLIDNCRVPWVRIGDGTDLATNVIIRNCIITGGGSTTTTYIESEAKSSQIIVTNCIILGYTGAAASRGTVSCANGCTYKNNIFFGDGSTEQFSFYNIANSSVNNNIFYGRIPKASATGTITNCSFKNNASIGAADNAFIVASNGNTVSPNVSSIVDPTLVFTDANIVPANAWDLSWVPTLQTNDLQGSGTDGTDVGATGSSIPFSTTGTPLPYIKVLDATELIKQGDPLNISIEALGN